MTVPPTSSPDRSDLTFPRHRRASLPQLLQLDHRTGLASALRATSPLRYLLASKPHPTQLDVRRERIEGGHGGDCMPIQDRIATAGRVFFGLAWFPCDGHYWRRPHPALLRDRKGSVDLSQPHEALKPRFLPHDADLQPATERASRLRVLGVDPTKLRSLAVAPTNSPAVRRCSPHEVFQPSVERAWGERAIYGDPT